MAIKYVQVLNSFVSTEGSDGIMTNYIYYSVLVVNTDGTRYITEGQLGSILHLLPYVRTPQDDLMELRETVSSLRNEINETIDRKINYVIDSLYPIPNVLEMNETEALAGIREAGLIPVLDISYPESTPANGIVKGYVRNPDSFKKVNLKIIHNVPEVVGLQEEEAVRILTEAGFKYEIIRKIVSGKENGTVLSCTRNSETILQVMLEVCSAIPETMGMPVERALRVLKEAGYQAETRNKVNTACAPGTVTKWENTTGRNILLYVSIPEKYEAKYVNVEWTTMSDSAGDTYGAIADYDNRENLLKVHLSYTVGCKSKRQIIKTNVVKSSELSMKDSSEIVMEPNKKGQMTLTLKSSVPFESLPSNFSVEMDTQFGLMKKREKVVLQFSLDW